MRSPKAAKRVPLLVIALVLVVVAAMIILGKVGGWLAAFLVPVALFSLALAVNVVVRLIKGPRIVVVGDEEE